MASSASGSMLGLIQREVADADVGRSRRGAQREHHQHREHETDAGADADQPRHASRDAPHHLLAPRAERHADADLTRAPRDGKRDDRIEADAGQHQAEAAEDAETAWRSPLAAPRVLQILRHRLRRDHRQRRRRWRAARAASPRQGSPHHPTSARRPSSAARRTGCTSGRTAARSDRGRRPRSLPCPCRARRRSPPSRRSDRSAGRNRRPTAFTVPKNCRAIRSVTTATRGVSARSRASNTRPYSSGMRSVSKKAGPAASIDSFDTRLIRPRRQRRSARRGPHRQAAQQRGGFDAGNSLRSGAVDRRTPSSPRSPSSRRTVSRSRASPRRPRRSRRAALSPLQHLQEDARAAEQQHRDRHLEDDERILQREPAMIDGLRPLVAQRRQQSTLVALSAGARPNATPVTSDSAIAKASTR